MGDGFQVDELELLPDRDRKFYGKKNYHIFWVVKGSCVVSWEGRSQGAGLGDMILMQPGHMLFLKQSGKTTAAHMIWLQVDSRMLTELSDEKTDLLHSFQFVPFGCTLVSASGSTAMLAKNLASRFYTISKDKRFGNDILLRGMLSVLLVMVLRICIDADFKKPVQKRPQFLIDSVFSFIRQHLNEEITLKRLEEEFFVSHEHISREFKKRTGQTVHQYILLQRLELSCRYLRAGIPVTEIWQQCGFGSYSYYFQALKKHYGVTPKGFT